MSNYNFTYIIGYRHRHDRIANLRRVLDWINGFSGSQVILVEQDTHSKIDNLNLKCQHIFIKSESPYNRSWAFNVGTKYAKSNIICFSDGDLIMNPNEFIEGLKAIEQFDVVSPYYSVIDLTQDESVLDLGRMLAVNRPGRGETDNQKINLCGGLVIFRREAIMKIGGWDERFIEWGAEDNMMTLKVEKFELTSTELKHRIYHLWHERVQPSPNLYQRNLQILNQAISLSKEDLIKVVGSQVGRNGMLNKYS